MGFKLRAWTTGLLALACVAAGAGPGAPYPSAVLMEWKPEFESKLPANARDLLLRNLTAQEAARLGGLRFEFPTDEHQWPFHYFARSDGTIELGVASLMFAKDIALAEAWLSVNRWSTSTLLDYMGALRFGRLDALAPARRTPLAALGIPADAARDPRVLDRRNETLDKLLLFVVAHELGHLLQPGGLEPQRRCIRSWGVACDAAALRRSEAAADEVAVELMRRAGLVPNAAALLFALDARHAGSPAEVRDEARRTDLLAKLSHPVDADRIRSLRDAIERRRDAFAQAMADVAEGRSRIQALLDELGRLAAGLADPMLAQHQASVSKTLVPEDLQPRRGPLPTLRPDLLVLYESLPERGYHKGEMRFGPDGVPMQIEVLWQANAGGRGAQVMLEGIRGQLSAGAAAPGQVGYVLDLGGDLYDLSFDRAPGALGATGRWRSRADPAVGGTITLRRADPADRLKV